MFRTAAAKSLTIAALVVTTSAVVAPAANAAPDCPNNHVCMWEDANFTGTRYVLQAAPGGYTAYEIDGWDGDNEISSVANNTDGLVYLYDNDLGGAQGDTRLLNKRTTHHDLRYVAGGDMDNMTESFGITGPWN